MSAVLHPVGPKPPRVYWVRRVVLLALAVVVLALVVNLLRGWFAPGEAEERPDATPTTTQVETPSTPAACAADALTVTATAPARVHAPEQPVHLVVTVANTGAVACTADLGAAAVTTVVTSGADRVWASTDCPVEPTETAPASRLLLLQPEARETADITWARVRSAEGCPEGLPTPRPGTYRLTTQVEATVSEPVVVELQ